jgi:hypothetical protein
MNLWLSLVSVMMQQCKVCIISGKILYRHILKMSIVEGWLQRSAANAQIS